MRKLTKILVAALMLAALSTPLAGNAQLIKSGYFNIDWQFNGLIGNDYADVASGWGMNFEGGYYVLPKMAVGLYVSYHTNNKYVGEKVLSLSNTSDLYADQQHSVYQVPFGAVAKYRFIEDSMWEPYVSLKLGAMYARMDSYTQVLKFYDTTWGFNIQPEIGFSFFPLPMNRCGFHLAFYYNYSTNKSKNLTYEINGYNNVGFHLGISF